MAAVLGASGRRAAFAKAPNTRRHSASLVAAPWAADDRRQCCARHGHGQRQPLLWPARPRGAWCPPGASVRLASTEAGPRPKGEEREEAGSASSSSAKGKEEEKLLFGIEQSLLRHVAILTGSQLMLNLGFSQVVPVMPLFAAQMGGHLGATGVGAVIAAPSLARVLVNVPLGRLADVRGRKPLMYVGTALTATGTILTGYSGSLAMMLPARFLVGVGSAASVSGSSAYMADLSDRAPQHRAKIMGLQQAIIGSVWVVGPALGGLFAEAYGLQNSFLVAGIGAGLCSLGYMQLPETLVRKAAAEAAAKSASSVANGAQGLRKHVADWWGDVKPLLQDPNQQALIALACIFPLRFSCFSTAVALHASSMGSGPKELGLMFSTIAVCQGLGMPLGSYLADKCGGAKKAIIAPAGGLACVAFASLALATTGQHLYISMALQGLTSAFVQPAVGAFTAEATPADRRGQAFSLHRQAADAIALAGPIAMGLLADTIGSPATITATAMAMGTCHLLYLLRARAVPPAAGAAAGGKAAGKG